MRGGVSAAALFHQSVIMDLDQVYKEIDNNYWHDMGFLACIIRARADQLETGSPCLGGREHEEIDWIVDACKRFLAAHAHNEERGREQGRVFAAQRSIENGYLQKYYEEVNGSRRRRLAALGATGA